MNIQNLIKWIVPFVYLCYCWPIFIWGSGISPDSCAYLAVAKNLHLGNGFTLYDNSYITNWPLLYPTLLACLTYITPNLLLTAGITNLSLGIITYFILNHTLKHPISKILLALCFVFPPFIKLYIMLWSEPLFLLLLVIGLLFWFDESKPTKKNLAIIFIAFSAACLTRYAGIFILAGLIITNFIQHKKITPKLVVGSLALLPVGINLWYNSHHAIQIVANNLAWNQLANLWHNLQHNLPVLILQLSVFTILFFTLKKSTQKTKPMAVAAVLYWLVIIAFAPLTAAELLRYLLPLIPLLIWAVDEAANFWTINLKVLGVITVCMMLGSFYFVHYSIKNGTGGYNKRSMKNTALKNYLKTKTGKIYSNAPDYIYFISEKSAELLKPTSTLNPNDEVIVVDQVTRKTDWPKQQTFVPYYQQAGFTCYKLQ